MADQGRNSEAKRSSSPGTDVVFRPLERADYSGLAALLGEGDRLHHDALPERIRPPNQAGMTEEKLAALLEDPDVRMVGAEIAGALAGTIRACYREIPTGRVHVARRSISVEELVVAPAHRRGGIARGLMAVIEDWAATRGAGEVELQVYEFNEGARRFYERLGYSTLSRRLSRRLP